MCHVDELDAKTGMSVISLADEQHMLPNVQYSIYSSGGSWSHDHLLLLQDHPMRILMG